jgi:hypothetical protein
MNEREERERRREGGAIERFRDRPPAEVETEEEARQVPGDRVRIMEFGRPPSWIQLGPEETQSLAQLIERGAVSGDPTNQYFVNSMPADLATRVRNGDAVVAIKRFSAGI